MNDINTLRKDTEKARTGIKNRGGRYLPALEDIIKLDSEHRELLKRVEELRAKRNSSSQAVGKAKASKNEAEAARLMAEVSHLKTEMAGQEEALATLSAKLKDAALGLPNFPHDSVPVGASESDNPLRRAGIEPKPPDFKPLDHQTFGEKLGILDSAAATRLSGSRFSLWRGAGARLMRSIISFQLDLHTQEHGYQEAWVPALVRPEMLIGTGQLPKFEADLYKIAATEGRRPRRSTSSPRPRFR